MKLMGARREPQKSWPTCKPNPPGSSTVTSVVTCMHRHMSTACFKITGPVASSGRLPLKAYALWMIIFTRNSQKGWPRADAIQAFCGRMWGSGGEALLLQSHYAVQWAATRASAAGKVRSLSSMQAHWNVVGHLGVVAHLSHHQTFSIRDVGIGTQAPCVQVGVQPAIAMHVQIPAARQEE